MRLFGREKKDTTQVELADVARYIQPDALCPTLAEGAYSDLVRLQRLELVDVYLPAGWSVTGERDFNVWVSKRLHEPPDHSSGERITLEEWCARWLRNEERWRVDVLGDDYREKWGEDAVWNDGILESKESA